MDFRDMHLLEQINKILKYVTSNVESLIDIKLKHKQRYIRGSDKF